ncbi:MAG: hypothetical protein ACFB9N_15395 [Geitlerinemataceae cyanobacterium]
MPSTSTALATYPLQLDLPAGSLTLALSPDTVREIQSALRDLNARLKAVAIRAVDRERRPQPERPLEYQYVGEMFLELFCNPNIWPTPFAAKVLLSVRDEQVRVSSEVELVGLNECLERYFDRVPD